MEEAAEYKLWLQTVGDVAIVEEAAEYKLWLQTVGDGLVTVESNSRV